MSDNIKRINKTLESTYGTNLRSEPVFRVVWSNDQREKRFGVYREHMGTIFLREFRGLQEVPKYPHIQRQWVLERWMPPELCYTDEIPATAEGSYEPIFVFMSEKGEALPVQEEVIHRIVWTLLHPDLPGHRTSEHKAQEQLEFDKEVKQNEEELTEQGRTWIGHRLHSKEAIIVPSRE